jgi:polysaccharide export outer membrane protein
MTSSCVPFKKINILKENSTAPVDSTIYKVGNSPYRMKNGDFVHVEIQSFEAGLDNNFQSGNSGNYFNSNSGIFMHSYCIDSEGMLKLPLIGQVQSTGKTIPELRNDISGKYNQTMPGSTVRVFMTNFRVTVLGEVRNPGLYYNYNDQLTLLEAIGMGGGISNFGNSYRVKIVRQTSNSMVVHSLDISKEGVLSNPNFFLFPNDVVYVEPVKVKAINLSLPQITPIISAVATAMSIINISILIANQTK